MLFSIDSSLHRSIQCIIDRVYAFDRLKRSIYSYSIGDRHLKNPLISLYLDTVNRNDFESSCDVATTHW